MSLAFVENVVRLLLDAGVPDAQREAQAFVLDNPGIGDTMSPEEAVREWLDAAGDALEWQDPARYGAS